MARKLPEPWTGRLIGKMHNNRITYQMVADELGIGKVYVGMLLNSRRKPDGVQKRLESAVNAIIEKQREEERTK